MENYFTPDDLIRMVTEDRKDSRSVAPAPLGIADIGQAQSMMGVLGQISKTPGVLGLLAKAAKFATQQKLDTLASELSQVEKEQYAAPQIEPTFTQFDPVTTSFGFDAPDFGFASGVDDGYGYADAGLGFASGVDDGYGFGGVDGDGYSGGFGGGFGGGDAFENGGAVKNAATAKKLASKGRYGDTELVHMSQEEIDLLEKILGTNLTQNPDTGLPEAFLGFLIPAAVNALGLPPIAGSLISGGISMLLKDDDDTSSVRPSPSRAPSDSFSETRIQRDVAPTMLPPHIATALEKAQETGGISRGMFSSLSPKKTTSKTAEDGGIAELAQLLTGLAERKE